MRFSRVPSEVISYVSDWDPKDHPGGTGWFHCWFVTPLHPSWMSCLFKTQNVLSLTLTTESDPLMVGCRTLRFLYSSTSILGNHWSGPTSSLHRWGLPLRLPHGSTVRLLVKPRPLITVQCSCWSSLLLAFSNYLESNITFMENSEVCICTFVHKLNFVSLEPL